jgi:hypothetical protein
MNLKGFVQAPYGLGTCTVCRRVMTLTKSGTLRVHGTGRRMNCSGSGQPPVASTY